MSSPLLAASCGLYVKVWDALGTSTSRYSKPTFLTDTNRVYSAAWSPDNAVLAFGGDSRAFYVKTLADKTCKEFTTERQAPLRCLSFGWGGELLVSGTADGTVALWNRKTAVHQLPLPHPIDLCFPAHRSDD